MGTHSVKPCYHAHHDHCCYVPPCPICAYWKRAGSRCCGKTPVIPVELYGDYRPNHPIYKRKKARAKLYRENPTPPEKILWEKIRNKRLGFRFTRQKVMYGYTLDFYCAEKKLAVEVDGKHHNVRSRREKDALRDAVLWKKGGIRTLRLPAAVVLGRLPLAVHTLLSVLRPEFADFSSQ